METAIAQTPARPKNWETFKRLLAFLAPYKISLGISAVLAIAGQAIQIGVVLLSSMAIGAIRSGHRHELWTLLTIIAAAANGTARTDTPTPALPGPRRRVRRRAARTARRIAQSEEGRNPPDRTPRLGLT